jgi:hypothetical protein
VGAVHRDSTFDERNKHAAFRCVRGQALNGPKENGMMRDDELNPGFDRFPNDLGSHSEASHDPLGRRGTIAQKQANIVPIRGQARRGELIQVVHYRAYRVHNRSQ